MTSESGTASPFDGDGAAELVAALLADPVTGGRGGTTASEVLTAALREVNEGGSVADAAQGERGLAAVAVLLAESAPELLDGAPDEPQLRARLAEWDTELTPARATLCRAVLRRLTLPEQNAWWQAVAGSDPAAATALLDRLDGLVAALDGTR